MTPLLPAGRQVNAFIKLCSLLYQEIFDCQMKWFDTEKENDLNHFIVVYQSITIPFVDLERISILLVLITDRSSMRMPNFPSR